MIKTSSCYRYMYIYIYIQVVTVHGDLLHVYVQQCVGSVMDPNVFLYSLLYKYRLENWFNK